jgi:hypothetical protein
MAQKPIAKSIYVCDDVVSDPSSGKVSILNLWDAVRVPAGESFPYALAKLCVFVWWRDGQGKVKTRIDIVQASTGTVVRRTKDYYLNLPDPMVSVWAHYKLEWCTFPAPGYYSVEVYCEDEFLDDQLIQVFPGEG